jgi:hypothetical protein
LLRLLAWQFTDNSEVLAASIIRVIISETLVNLYQTTRRNNPEHSHLHTRSPENLKSSSDITVLTLYFIII